MNQESRNPASIDVTVDMGPKPPLKERWANYQPSKKSLYKSVGYSVFWTVVLGFAVGGWHTTGGAQELAYKSRVDYAAELCADRFMAADISGQNLASLKKVNGSSQRGRALQKGNWVAAPSGASEAFILDVTRACSDRLVTGGADKMTGGKTA